MQDDDYDYDRIVTTNNRAGRVLPENWRDRDSSRCLGGLSSG